MARKNISSVLETVKRPTITALQAFRRVLEARSFSKAARLLGVSNGAASKLVSQLEADVGARLLNRTTRSLVPTEEGRYFYDAAVRILDDLDRALDHVQAQTGSMDGRLRVSVPTSFALVWLAKRTPAFQSSHPLLRLDMTLDDQFVDLVQGGYDCAIRIATQLRDSAVVARPLGSVERVLVGSPAYVRTAPALSEVQDLRHHNCLLYSLAEEPTLWPLRSGGAEVPVHVNGNLRVNNSAMLREAILQDCGLALVPKFVVEDLLLDGRVTEVLKPHRPRPHIIFGVTAARGQQPHKVTAFFKFIKEALATGR